LTVQIPLVVILGAIGLLAWRYMGLRVWMAIVCALFGFYLAATSFAPDIRRLVVAVVRAITGSH
jgi:hypothetical protein